MLKNYSSKMLDPIPKNFEYTSDELKEARRILILMKNKSKQEKNEAIQEFTKITRKDFPKNVFTDVQINKMFLLNIFSNDNL